MVAPDVRLMVGTQLVALRDELRCFDVGRASGRAIAGCRRARAYLLLRLLYTHSQEKACDSVAKDTVVNQTNVAAA